MWLNAYNHRNRLYMGEVLTLPLYLLLFRSALMSYEIRRCVAVLPKLRAVRRLMVNSTHAARSLCFDAFFPSMWPLTFMESILFCSDARFKSSLLPMCCVVCLLFRWVVLFCFFFAQTRLPRPGCFGADPLHREGRGGESGDVGGKSAPHVWCKNPRCNFHSRCKLIAAEFLSWI